MKPLKATQTALEALGVPAHQHEEIFALVAADVAQRPQYCYTVDGSAVIGPLFSIHAAKKAAALVDGQWAKMINPTEVFDDGTDQAD